MSDNVLINHIHNEPRYDRIWQSLTVEQKRQVIEFAEGELALAKIALDDAKDEEGLR